MKMSASRENKEGRITPKWNKEINFLSPLPYLNSSSPVLRGRHDVNTHRALVSMRRGLPHIWSPGVLRQKEVSSLHFM